MLRVAVQEHANYDVGLVGVPSAVYGLGFELGVASWNSALLVDVKQVG